MSCGKHGSSPTGPRAGVEVHAPHAAATRGEADAQKLCAHIHVMLRECIRDRPGQGGLRGQAGTHQRG